MEQSKCSKNRVSRGHGFPPGSLQAIDVSNGVDATCGSRSVGESGVSAPYLGSRHASLNGVSSLLVTPLDAGVFESESRTIMSGVWNDGVSTLVFPETFAPRAVGGPAERYAWIGENAERRKEERVERVCEGRLDIVEDVRR